MEKYVVITNRGSLNRRYLEMLGVSTKRDQVANSAVIGNKGTGKKFSAVASLRMGLATSITSNDEAGSYYLTFIPYPIDIGGVKIRQVVYRYFTQEKDESGEWKRSNVPSNLTVESLQDWDKPIGSDDKKSFKMLREHIIDACDEDKAFTCELAEQTTFAPPGMTRVYLTYTDEIKEILQTPERYFKFMSTARPKVVVSDIGEIWPKSDANNTRHFLLGVLVDCTNDASRTTIFDYSLYNKDLLSEERLLKSSDTYRYWVGKLFARLLDPLIMRVLFQGVCTDAAQFEQACFGTTAKEPMADEVKKGWLDAAHAVFGKKIALPSKRDVVNSDVQQIYGYTLVTAGDTAFKKFLAAVGVPEAETIFPVNPSERLEFVGYKEFDRESRVAFLEAFSVFAERYPASAKIPIVFFHPLDESMRAMAGFAGYDDTVFKEIWIATTSRTSLPSMESLLKTLVHETRHCVTRSHDKDRKFVAKADADLLAEILRSAGYAHDASGARFSPRVPMEVIVPVFVDTTKRSKPKASTTIVSAMMVE